MEDSFNVSMGCTSMYYTQIYKTNLMHFLCSHIIMYIQVYIVLAIQILDPCLKIHYTYFW